MFSGSFVQLGWLQSAVNWCYDHILAPAFEFISDLVGSIISVFIDYALLPILELNMKFTYELLKTVFENFLYNLLYSVGKTLLWCLDAVEQTFRLFAGLDPVYIQDKNGQYVESGSFVLAMLKSNSIMTALLGLIAASFVLCFLVAILATVRAMGDFQNDGKKTRSVSKVLRYTANSLLRLLLIPIMSLFLIMLGDAILKSIDLATNSDQAHVSDIVYTMATLDAVRTDDNPSPVDLALEVIGIEDAKTINHSDAEFYNSTTRAAALYEASDEMKRATSDFGLSDKYRKPFYTRETISTGSLKRDVLAVVLQTFDIRKMDYVIMLGGSLMFILIFGILAVSMLTRAFDLMLLILVEPFFAAFMPLDEGERFERWQETFMGRLASCYGMVVAVNVYLSVIGLIFSNKVAFFGEGTTPGVIYIVNLIFAMVGGYSIIKAGPVITSILSSSAAARETEGIAMGNTLTVGAMRMMSYPIRRVGNFLIGKGINEFSESMGDLLAGKTGSSDPDLGGAFGKSNKTTANGENTFLNKKKGTDAESKLDLKAILQAEGKTDSKADIKDILKTDSKADVKDILKTESKADVKDILKTDSKADIKDILKTESKLDLKEVLKEELTDETKAELKDKIKSKVKSDVKDALTEQLKDESLMAAGLLNLEGGLAPENGLLPPEYEFLEAGKVPDPIKNPTGYTYVGQNDAEERKEKKEMDELLGAEIDEEALFAAESGTGIDINGDGKISESSNTFSPVGYESPNLASNFGEKKMQELLGAEIKEQDLFGAGEDYDSILNDGANFDGLDDSFKDSFEKSYDDNFEDYLKDNDEDNI